MSIPEDIIERIKLSNDIESVVREYLPDLKSVGRNWKACCPFHSEKTPSFIVSPERGIFRCFGCNAVGDVFKFVMLADNISWPEAVRRLAKKANIEIQETKQDQIKASEKTKLFNILESSAEFYHKYLLEGLSGKAAREYLEKRGVAYETVKRFKLGFAPKGRLLENAVKKGYTVEDLSKAGLITKTGKGIFFEYMSERIVFPIFDAQGRIVAFGGRTLTNQDPKYLNTPETVIYSKSSNLYGLFQTLPQLRKERKMIILEGYMDVIIPWQFGIAGAVATLGTSFTRSHAKLVSRYCDVVTLLFDSDDAGRAATQRALEVLVESGAECTVSVLPENIDADEYLNKNGKESFLKLLVDSSKSTIDFMVARYVNGQKNSPEAKAKAASSLLDFITKNSNSIVQREWIKNVAQRINVSEEAVWKEFEKKQCSKRAKNHLQNGENSDLHVIKDKKVSMSLEENLLNFILSNRSYAGKVKADCFKDERCLKVFNMAVSGLSDTEILSALSGEDIIWFSELILNAIDYSDVEEAFNIILKDVKAEEFRKKRRHLEREIFLMSEGKKEKDEKILNEYKKLTVLLKSSWS